jgi:N-acetylglucosaminyl-diphospho-decaprenol L-rhamnosyltransferase
MGIEGSNFTMRAAVDAVVVSYNSRDTLRDCVAPICSLPGVEVTVVDNDSPDDALATIADLPIRIVEAGRNGGFAFGCNLGTSGGNAPYVLLLNPDARIEPAALATLVSALEDDPGLAMAGPRILDDEGGLMRTQRSFPRLRSTWAQALFLHRLARRARWADEVVWDPEAYERPASPDWISGACMLVRRTALEEIGGLDERFFLYCEDIDLCRSLRAAGHGIRYEPAATVMHHGGHSAPRSAMLAIYARSRVLYARKHYRRVAVPFEVAGVVLGEATHTLTSVRRPSIARGHAAALRAALSPARGG